MTHGLNGEKKDVVARKKDLRVSVHGTSETKEQIDQLLLSEATRARITQIMGEDGPSEASKCLVRRYLVSCLIYNNAQRPGQLRA